MNGIRVKCNRLKVSANEIGREVTEGESFAKPLEIERIHREKNKKVFFLTNIEKYLHQRSQQHLFWQHHEHYQHCHFVMITITIEKIT